MADEDVDTVENQEYTIFLLLDVPKFANNISF